MKFKFFRISLILITLFIGENVFSQTEPPSNLEGETLRTWLKSNWYDGQHNTLGYDEARSQMYGYIDKRADNQLYCVYTGYHVNATYSTGSVGSINCEHTIPQSWFNQASPMRSDIFHLYPTHSNVNSSRGSLPFGDINDSSADKWFVMNSSNSGLTVSTSVPSLNIDNYSELITNSKFEPREDHKGDLARSAFYFYTMYPTQAGNITRLCSLETLYQWHLEDPVDEWEMLRNDRIEEIQGNRNPYIDYPEIVCRAWGFECLYDFNFTSTPVSTILVNTQYSYTITYEGEGLTLSCTQKPEWLTFSDGESGEACLYGTPTELGDYSISLILTDNEYSVNQNFSINVNDGNVSFTVFNKDFEDQSLTSGGWTSNNVIGSEQSWDVPTTNYGHNNSHCGYMSGYDDAAVANEDWFISPSVNFDNITSEKLSFWSAFKYDGENIQLYYSSNYSGSGAPENTEWTEITGFTLSSGNWIWAYSGEIDLSNISGTNVYLAFKYTSNNTYARAWELDDIKLEAVQNVSITDFSIDESAVNLYPNPFNNNLNIEYFLNKNSNVSINIYDITGKIIENIETKYQTEGNHTIIWNTNENIQDGIYIIKIQTSEQIINKKVIYKN